MFRIIRLKNQVTMTTSYVAMELTISAANVQCIKLI